jgi:hypothetical protein
MISDILKALNYDDDECLECVCCPVADDCFAFKIISGKDVKRSGCQGEALEDVQEYYP